MRHRSVILWGALVWILAACSMTATSPTNNNPPATNPTTAPTVNESVTTTDPCAANASGLSITSVRSQANTATLPNGRPFPGNRPNTQQTPGRLQTNQVVIRFTPDSSQQDRNQYIQSIGGQARRRIDGLDVYAVTLRPNMSPDNLPASNIVTLVEIDYQASALQVEPNDPRYNEQWAADVMGLSWSWGQLPANPTPVTVAVIDSGICATHPDLSGRVLSGYDFIDDNSDPADQFGHGCAVAGVIAANANNGQGIAGVAPNARIMPLRVLDSSGNGDYSAISQAIVYAADNGADIINLSLAGRFYSQVMADAVTYATSRGVDVVAASGNFGSEELYYPAAFPGVVAVGSVDPTLQRSSFSNYGAHVRMMAPGRDILTTSMDGGYDFQTGTSFAAPQVAGLMALSMALGTDMQIQDAVVYLPPENACP